MRASLRAGLSSIAAAALLSMGACSGDVTATYRNALTDETCVPNSTFLVKASSTDNKGSNAGGNTSPTGIPGDNLDDERSGKIDCLGDGNSGQGDDKKHNCEFPQPGCDDTGCCDEDVLPPPDGDDGDDEDPVEPPPPPDPDPIDAGAPPVEESDAAHVPYVP
jgi:hypothetical protein